MVPSMPKLQKGSESCTKDSDIETYSTEMVEVLSEAQNIKTLFMSQSPRRLDSVPTSLL